MALADLLPLRADHHRPSSVIAQSTFPFTVALLWSVTQPVRIRLHGESLSGTPSITLTGFTGAGAHTHVETVPHASPSMKLSDDFWLSLSQVSSASSDSGQVTLEGIEQSGQPVLVDQILASAIPVRLRSRTLRQDQVEPGASLNEQWFCYVTGDGYLPADRLVIDGTTYLVENVVRQFSSRTFHHSELWLTKLP